MSASVSPSLTQTRSQTPSPSQVPSPTGTGSPTQSTSKSPTHTPSTSATQSGSPSVSASMTGTGTGSPSQARTPSRTSTRTPRPSLTMTPSQVASPTQSPSNLKPGESRSQTPTPSASPTPLPYALGFDPPSGGGGADADGAVLLSDSLPPGELMPVLSRCPRVPAQLFVTIACNMTSAAALNGGALPSPPLLVAYAPSASAQVQCTGDGDAPIPLAVQLLPQYGSPSFVGVLSCTLTGSDGSAMGVAEQNVSVTATLWPVFDDVIVVSANGLSRSVEGLGPVKVNSTDALVSAAARAAPAARLRGLEVGASQELSVAAAVANPAAVLAAMHAVWGGVALPIESATAFALTLFSSTPLVLRSRARAFAQGASVTIGAILCNGTVVSADGEWLVTYAPSQSALCGGGAPGSSACSYASVTVRNPDTIDETGSAAEPMLGAALTCPPFCAGDVGSGVFPLPIAGAHGGAVSFVAATLSGGFAAAIDLTRVVPGVSSPKQVALAASSGLFYSQSCSVTGLFTDPSTGACTNMTDPAFAFCAFGSGDSCRPCPSGATCPGGLRAWPHQGYWSPLESSAAVIPCSEPNAQAKCLGWNAALSGALCGPGYRQGSFLCSACADQHYLSGDGSCLACPIDPSLYQRYSGLFLVVAAVSVFALTIYVLLVGALKATGHSTRGALRVGSAIRACFDANLSHRGLIPSAERASPSRPLLDHCSGRQQRGAGMPPVHVPLVWGDSNPLLFLLGLSRSAHRTARRASLGRCVCYTTAWACCSFKAREEVCCPGIAPGTSTTSATLLPLHRYFPPARLYNWLPLFQRRVHTRRRGHVLAHRRRCGKG